MSSVKIKTKRFIACPSCGEGEYGVEHMFEGEWAGRSFGPWHCHSCHVEFFGKTEGGDVLITKTSPSKSRYVLSLIKYEGLYLVVKSFLGDENGRIDGDRWDYFYHSHQCPTNLTRAAEEAYTKEEGRDPHGVFSFVASVPFTEDNVKKMESSEGSRLEGLFDLFDTDGEPLEREW